MEDKKIFWGQILHTPDQTKPQPVEMFPGAAPGAYRIGTRNPEFEELMGSINDEPVTSPTAEEASALGLLRGLLAALQSQSGGTDLAALATLLTAINQKDIASQTTAAAILTALQGLSVSIRGSLPALSAGSNVIGKVGIDGISSMSLDDAMIVLPTDAQGVKKTKQIDTTTALAASAAYTGSTINTSTERRITGIVAADKDGTFAIEASVNGTNWYAVYTQGITNGTPHGFDVPCYTEYTRVKYTNGAEAQTSFILVAYTMPI